MEQGQTKEQTLEDKKKEWANVSDEEEEEDDDDRQNKKQVVKKTKLPKKERAAGATKPTGKASNNIFVCNQLDADDDEDEPEPTQKKEKKTEGPSMRDFVAKPNQAGAKEEIKPALSKKEQKKKELEEFDKILAEFKTTDPAADQTAPAGEVKATDTANADANQAQPSAEGGDKGEAKKKKKKKAKDGEKKEDEKKEDDKNEKKEEHPLEEAKEGEKQTTQPVDVEKKIQEIMKNKAKQNQPKKTGPNLETAKQEILARQQNAKKPKKKFEDL